MAAFLSRSLEELIRLRYDARGFSFLPRQPVSSLLSGRYASRLRGRGLVFEELRGYRPGDDIRTIDWKATARLRKTQIRVYSEERERPVMLLVDQRSSMHFGSKRTTKATAAVELGALAAWRTLDVGDRLGAIVFGDAEMSVLSAKRNKTNVLRVLNELVLHNQRLHSKLSPLNSTTLNGALKRMLNLAKHDNLCVIVTDFAGADDETRRLVKKLASTNDVLACLVYDPLGISFRGAAPLFATDGVSSKKFNPNSEFESAFKGKFLDRMGEIRTILSSIRIPILPICTHEPVMDQVATALGARG